MVIVKLMGIMDLLSAIAIVLLHYNVLPWRIGLIFACYLAFKGIAFMGDIASIIDLIAALYMVLLFFHVHTILTFFFVIYLLQKVAFSFA